MEAETPNALTRIKYVTGTIAAIACLTWMFWPSASQPRADVAMHKRIPVYYWHMWSGEWQPVMAHVCDEFNASQDKYEVIPLQVPSAEGSQKFLLSVAGGDPPDVMAQWTPAISAWAQSGILQPLDTMMTPAEHKYFMHDTFPVVHQNGWYKGRLYGVLINFDVYACYYRPAEFRAVGLDPDRFPTSLEGLVSDASRLNQSDPSGRLTRVGFLPNRLPNYIASFNGGLDETPSGGVQVDTPENERALQFIFDTHRTLGFDRIMRFDAGLTSDDGANWPFITGQTAIALDGEWRVLQLAQYAPQLKYDVAMLPPPAGGTPEASFSATSYLTIPAGAKHTEGAWEFIKFWNGLDNPVQGAKYKTWFGWMPDSPQMATAPIYEAYLRRYPQYRTFVRLAASSHIETLPPVPYSEFLEDKIETDDDLAERGAASPKAALALLQSQVNEQVKERKELGYDQ